MTVGDLRAVAEIEKTSQENFWTQADFEKVIASFGVLGCVITEDSKIVAYYVYEYDNEDIHILNIVIHPDHRRQGLGTAMMGVLKNRLSEKRFHLKFDVRESNLPGHLFLKKNGFKAKMDRGYFVDYGVYGEKRSEDAYCFCYTEECCGK